MVVLVLQPGDEYGDEAVSGRDMRERAVQLQMTRLAKLRQAAESFRANNLTAMGRASHYSQEGRSLSASVSLLHRQAAERILHEQNPQLATALVLDLHYLTVVEACAVTTAFLHQHAAVGRSGRVEIITGRGNHSADNRSRLMPAVWALLGRERFYFVFDGVGTFTVNVNKRK